MAGPLRIGAPMARRLAGGGFSVSEPYAIEWA